MLKKYYQFIGFVHRYISAFLLVWFLFILSLCAIPGRMIPSSNWLELLSFDKLVHTSIFFILVGLWIVYVLKRNSSLFLIAIGALLAAFYGGAIEWMQANVFSERSADWYDFIADSFGCLVAYLCRDWIQRQTKRALSPS
jgi:hypothetical protein